MKITNVMASSLDGKIASGPLESDADRQSYCFTSEEDHEFVRSQIMAADAIITGANSMRASRFAWQQKGKNGTFPKWLVLSNHGLDEDLGFWKQTEVPRYLVSQKSLQIGTAKHGVENLVYGSALPGKFVHQFLKSQGCTNVLLFGGGAINQIFYEEGLVNELKITICPIIIAKKSAPSLVNPTLKTPTRFELLSSQQTGNHVFLHYRILHI
jgi:5-amino-6-(5-phosphoribosylamino)uracil reductase